MRANGRGRIINISRIGGRFTFPLMGVYNSTRYAVGSLSDVLRGELRPFGVDVAPIEPGYIKTELGDTSVSIAKQYATDANPYHSVMARTEQLNSLLLMAAVGPEHMTPKAMRLGSRRAIDANVAGA